MKGFDPLQMLTTLI